MGEYYLLANHAKRQYICPFDLGHSGGKLHHQVSKDGLGAAALFMLSRHGGWDGDSVSILGDEGDYYDYSRVEDEYENITSAVKDDILGYGWADF